MLYGDTPARRAIYRAKHLPKAAAADIAQEPPGMSGMCQLAVADTAKRLAKGWKVGNALLTVGCKRVFKQIPCAEQQLAHARTDPQRVRRRPDLEPTLEKGNVCLRARAGLPTIRSPPRQHLVQAHTQAENVRADVPPELRISEIGRHVVEGADHVAAADRCRALDPMRDLEVDELGRAVRTHDDICRLDIAVNDATGRSIGEAIKHPEGDAHRLVRP